MQILSVYRCLKTYMSSQTQPNTLKKILTTEQFTKDSYVFVWYCPFNKDIILLFEQSGQVHLELSKCSNRTKHTLRVSLVPVRGKWKCKRFRLPCAFLCTSHTL